MIEVFKIVIIKQNMTLSFPKLVWIPVLLRQGTTTIIKSNFHYDLRKYSFTPIGYPRLVCGTRLVTGARLISVQMSQTPGLYTGPGVYPGPGFYPKFYGMHLCIICGAAF